MPHKARSIHTRHFFSIFQVLAVVVREDALQDRTRARGELGRIGALQRVPAIALRKALRRNRRSQPHDEHQGLI